MTEVSKVLGVRTSELRKSKKPLIEKKRRERINTCLDELKKLVIVDSAHKENGRYAKLEKADILEMTVTHLRSMQEKHATVSEPAVSGGKFGAGFVECANEVTRYLATIDCLESGVKSRLLSHLSTCMNKVNTTPIKTTEITKSRQNVLQESNSEQAQIPVATQASSLPGQYSQTVSSMTLTPVNAYNTPVTCSNNGQTLVVATSAPLMTATVNAIPLNTQFGKFTIILPNGQATGPVIPVYTNFTPVSSPQCVASMPVSASTALLPRSPPTAQEAPSHIQINPIARSTPSPTTSIPESDSMWRPW